MKIKNLALVIVPSLISLGANATTQPVFDVDGFERHTTYNSGPVSSATIASDSAHNLEVYLFSREIGGCTTANVYSSESGEYIASAYVDFLGGSHGKVRTVKASIPEEFLFTNKSLKVSCTNTQSERFYVHVNVPGAPIIDWQASVEPTGEFKYQYHSYPYHTSYTVSSTLNINNQNYYSGCRTIENRGVELGLFHGESGKGPFHSDVFTSTTAVDNSAIPQPVIQQTIECENAAAKTKAYKVWSLTDEASISLIYELIVVQ